MRAVSIAVALGAASLCGGCSSSKGKVTVNGDEGRKLLLQSFGQAYISSSHDGEYDVVLIQDPQAGKAAAKDNRPLQPMTAAELRQVVHIHVFWQAQGGSVAKDGVVTNAAIDWYVIAHEASDRPELLRYEGAGYVMLDEGRNTTSVEIRDGSMRKMEVRGGLQDPLGPAHLRGTITAQRNSQFVRDTLADLRARMRVTKTAVTSIR
jgi:hypothetical protein